MANENLEMWKSLNDKCQEVRLKARNARVEMMQPWLRYVSGDDMKVWQALDYAESLERQTDTLFATLDEVVTTILLAEKP